MPKVAFCIGNGTSRKDFDLNLLKGHGTSFGCNLLYRESENFAFPDYIVSIEDYRKEMIREDGFPAERSIFPPKKEQYEALGYYNDRGMFGTKRGARSNAGMNCLVESIRMGHNMIYLLGYDFMVNGEQAISNMFEGKKETRCSFADSLRRVRYFDWFCGKNPDVHFQMLFPREPKQRYHKLEAMNVSGSFYDTFEDKIYTLNAK